MKRRSFLKFSAASAASAALGSATILGWQPRANAATLEKTFYVTEGFIEQADGTDVYFRGFSGSPGQLDVPGGSMIVQQGDTLRVTIYNTLGVSTSFVIDGLVNSGRIAPGGAATVEFTANQAGSYLYYDGRNAPYNRIVGLHGGLAVMPSGSSNELYAGSPSFRYQLFWLLNDIDPAWHSSIRNGNAPGGRFVPRYFTINGLSGRPPGAPGYGNATVDAGYDPRTKLSGYIGDRTLLRVLNAGMCRHSLHWHANHLEWLTQNGQIRDDIWLKDIIPLDNDKGAFDAIYPFEPPPDAYPPVMHGHYPMHLHDEMTQTAGGGLYQFGAMTHIEFK